MRCPLPLLLFCLLAMASGCDGPGSQSGRSLPDAPPDSASRERVVVLQAGPLHLERDIESPGVTDVQAGALLEVVPDSAAGDGWERVATWDDRRGWIETSRLMDPVQWSHYGRALGGVSPILLRPAYPAEGGHWVVEAPLGTPGITPASTAWLLGDSARGARVTAIDSLENICGGERHRFGVLDLGFATADWPLLEEGLLATPSGGRPTTRRLAVGPLEPDPALLELVRRAAGELGPSGATGPDPEAIAWSALGEEAAWAALSWPIEDAATGQAQLASALVFRRAGDGWERAGTLGPAASSAEIPTPAWRPVAAYSTGGGIPSLLLLEGLEYEGAHLDIWIERGARYERIYRGYYWGC